MIEKWFTQSIPSRICSSWDFKYSLKNIIYLRHLIFSMRFNSIPSRKMSPSGNPTINCIIFHSFMPFARYVAEYLFIHNESLLVFWKTYESLHFTISLFHNDSSNFELLDSNTSFMVQPQLHSFVDPIWVLLATLPRTLVLDPCSRLEKHLQL